MKPRVSVVIPSLNGKKFLRSCLPSLEKQVFKDFEVIVVDNGSTDGTIEFLRRDYPRVRVIENSRNLGFSKAVNQGIHAAKGGCVALLNNDTKADKNWLQELVKALDSRQDVYFCASKMLSFERSEKEGAKRRHIKDRRLIDSAGIGWSWQYLNGHDIGRGENDGPRFSKEGHVFGACAGAAIYRRKLFAEIGFFDERFFAYFEDVDFSLRAQLAGFKCLYIPTAIVYHRWEGTGGRMKVRKMFLTTRNRMLVNLKNLPLEFILKYKIKYIRAFLAPFIRAFFTDPRTSLPAVLAHLQVLLLLPWVLGERQQAKRLTHVTVKELEKILGQGEYR